MEIVVVSRLLSAGTCTAGVLNVRVRRSSEICSQAPWLGLKWRWPYLDLCIGSPRVRTRVSTCRICGVSPPVLFASHCRRRSRFFSTASFIIFRRVQHPKLRQDGGCALRGGIISPFQTFLNGGCNGSATWPGLFSTEVRQHFPHGVLLTGRPSFHNLLCNLISRLSSPVEIRALAALTE